MRKDKEMNILKKRFTLVTLLLFVLFFISGCNQDETKNSNKEKMKSVFTEKDKEKAIEMIENLNEQLVLFESEVNEAISKKEIDVGDNEVFRQTVDKKGEEIVFQPFLEDYPDSLVNDRGDLKVTYANKSSEDCTFGNCNYDSIVVPTIEVGEEEWLTYNSQEFGVNELTLSNVGVTYSNEQDSDSTYISFVKGESGELYFSFNPIVKSLNFNLKEWNQEFASIKSNVPESEVETEEEEFRRKVEEVLAKYPPLQ